MNLDKFLGPSKTSIVVLKKVFLDQLVFGPLLIGTLLSLFALSQGLGPQQVKEKVKGVC